MGKASRTKSDISRREKIAAQRAAARRAEQRRRILIASGSVIAVLAIVLAFVLVKMTSGSGKAAGASNGPTGAALSSLVNDVTTIPTSMLDQVGGGSITNGGSIGASPSSGGNFFTAVNGSALTSGGKPEFLYIGAEYCPYCAAQRWAMIVALSRFGTFSGLSTIHSSSIDTPANIPTWTFYKSSYTSKYLAFTPVELTTNVPDSSSPSNYVPLQTATAAQQVLWKQYDPAGSIPFMDIGGKYAAVGNPQPFGPLDLQGMTWNQVAAALRDPSSTIGQGALGTANYITAAICKLTGNQPASACTPAVQALEAKL